MPEPLVSVIIPVYNVLPYLREALDSVINQTYQNLEIIIVDDGSTDGSGAVCDEYRTDPRVKVIHQENRGLSGARNTGLDLMTGEYVSFLDSDDAFRSDAIEYFLNVLTRENADMVTCGCEVYETEGPLNGARRRYCVIPDRNTVLATREALVAILEGRYIVSAWNKFYRKTVWEQIRFPEGCIYEDVLVAPSVAEQCERIAVISQALIRYRKRSGSITRTRTVENIKSRIEAQNKLREYLESITPALPSESVELCRENDIRFMIFGWAELKKQRAPSEATESLRKEILRHAGKETSFRKTKSRMAWRLFRTCPGMLIPARACFRCLKRLLRREREVVA